MKRALTASVFALLICVPSAGSAQGHGKSHGGGGGNKAVQAQGAQKQDRGGKARQQKAAPAKMTQKQQPRYAGKAQQGPSHKAQHVSTAKTEHGRAKSVKVTGAKSTQRVVANGKRERDNIRAVSRSLSGRSARERAALAVISRAGRRGVDDAFVVSSYGDHVRVKNRSGRVLVDMDDDRARNLGYWDVRPVSYDLRSSAPSFCRSGAGHPVWGRQWCIEKGFGLGRYHDLRWGRVTTVGDLYFTPRYYSTGNLVGDVLLGLIGAVAYDRLALHAISLGYTDPLRGVWVGEPYGPRVLQLYSAGYPVAEIVDADRDDRADIVVVALDL